MNEKAIGNKLKNLREKLGLTKEQVATGIGVSFSAVCMYEAGKRIPRDEIKIKYAGLFDTTVQNIFFDHDVTEGDNERITVHGSRNGETA